ncbi:hypothetical protein F4805DRAFT_268660 [Annulohypoxylon moriforme]|nr:hypothetical protein F4805DRAFT_268660 [Annulohypoxylon moriforme]
MPSTTKTLLTTLLAATASANSFPERDTDNCPGVTFVRNTVSGCCVGGTVDSPYLSVCKGWPICQGPTTTTWTATPITCATIVTDGANYDNEISSARESLKASGTHLVTPLDGATVTGGASATASPGQSGSATATVTGEGSSATSASGSDSSSDSTTSAAAAATSEGAAAGLVAKMGVTGGAVMAFVAALL